MNRPVVAALTASAAAATACGAPPQAEIGTPPPQTAPPAPDPSATTEPTTATTSTTTATVVTVTSSSPVPTVVEPFYVWPPEDETILAETVTLSRQELLACIRSYEQGADGYATDTGNGYYGAYQFDAETWRSVGGSGNPAHASPAEQDARASMLIDRRGLAPWPTPNRRCA